jgi:putative hydrolase of the HAD superfamily
MTTDKPARTTAPISVMLFDLDDTLFAHRSAVVAGIAAHRAALGGVFAAADENTAARRWNELEETQYHRYLTGELSYAEQRRARARGFVEDYGVLLEDHEADAWYDAYFLEYTRAWTLHDDALPCLDLLAAAGIRFGIITNGELAFQTAKIERVGLAGRVERVITSGELGYAKPDARIFEHACSVFGVAPSEVAYVGDRLRTDAIGASAAGLTGVWLDRLGAASANELAAARVSSVPVIRTLVELPAALGIRG